MARQKNARRKDGRIARQVYIGRGEDGKRKYKTVYGYTQKEVDEAVLNVKLALKKGIDVAAENDLVSDWSKSLLHLKSETVSPGHYKNFESKIKYINFRIGNLPITKLRTADIQEIITDISKHNPSTGKKSAKKTLIDYRSIFRQICQLAIDNRVMDYNPANAVQIATNAPQEHRRALTEEEQRWILETPHRAQRAAMLMMYAGLRRGELIPLTWNDVDLENGIIKVNKAVFTDGGALKIKNMTKTEAGMREIAIPNRLVHYLSEQKRDSVFVCPNTSGGMMSETSWRRMWDSYLKDLNVRYGEFTDGPKSKFDPKGVPMVIPHITAHWLRHTFASMLYMAGVDVLTAKEQLGHADIKTTLEIYTHLDKKYKQNSMDRLNAYLDGGNDASHMQVIK